MGLTISMVSAAKDSAVGGSYSRSVSKANNIKACMMQARVTDGVKPAIAANKINTGTPMTKGRTFPRLLNR